MSEVTAVVQEKALLGEGPCWDEMNQYLLWTDILAKKIHIYYPETNKNRSFEIGQYVGAISVCSNGDLLLATEKGFQFFQINTRKLTPIYDPEKNISTNRFNDGKCDPRGRFWAGTMGMNPNQPTGSLYRLDNDFTVNKMIDNVTISNGIAWDESRNKMYFIDTPTKKITSFDFDINTGDISGKKDIIDFPSKFGDPDGMTIDKEGMLWVAGWGAGKVTRWNPKDGTLLTEINVPAKYVTSCTFGGKNLDILYITTARIGMNEEELNKQPLAGSIFSIKTNTKGLPSHKFKIK